MTASFSVSNLDVFQRPGVRAKQDGKRAGCRITFPVGWGLSVQWGPGMYGSNYDSSFSVGDQSQLTAKQAEIAVIQPGGGLVEWADGDTVQGWCSMERVQCVIDLLAAGSLIDTSGPTPIARDGHEAAAS